MGRTLVEAKMSNMKYDQGNHVDFLDLEAAVSRRYEGLSFQVIGNVNTCDGMNVVDGHDHGLVVVDGPVPGRRILMLELVVCMVFTRGDGVIGIVSVDGHQVTGGHNCVDRGNLRKDPLNTLETMSCIVAH